MYDLSGRKKRSAARPMSSRTQGLGLGFNLEHVRVRPVWEEEEISSKADVKQDPGFGLGFEVVGARA